MNVEDRLEILELDLIFFEKEARTLRERLRLATREPLSDDVISKFADAEYMVCNNAFTMGVRWAEQQHGIGVDDE